MQLVTIHDDATGLDFCLDGLKQQIYLPIPVGNEIHITPANEDMLKCLATRFLLQLAEMEVLNETSTASAPVAELEPKSPETQQLGHSACPFEPK